MGYIGAITPLTIYILAFPTGNPSDIIASHAELQAVKWKKSLTSKAKVNLSHEQKKKTWLMNGILIKVYHNPYRIA